MSTPKFSVVYYSDERASGVLREYCLSVLYSAVRATGGEVVEMVGPRKYKKAHEDIYRKIIDGLRKAQSDDIYLAEDDVLYPAEHFQTDWGAKIYYNLNVMVLNAHGFFPRHTALLSGLCGDKGSVWAAIEKKLQETEQSAGGPAWAEPDSTNQVFSSVPIVDIRHGSNLTGMREPKDGQYLQEIEHWGKAADYAFLFNGCAKGDAPVPAPKPVKVKRPDVVASNCCVGTDNSGYVRINGDWYQVVFLEAKRHDNGTSDYLVGSWQAKACHRCGARLGKETQPYAWGRMAQIDDNIMAVWGEQHDSKQLGLGSD